VLDSGKYGTNQYKHSSLYKEIPCSKRLLHKCVPITPQTTRLYLTENLTQIQLIRGYLQKNECLKAYKETVFPKLDNQKKKNPHIFAEWCKPIYWKFRSWHKFYQQMILHRQLEQNQTQQQDVYQTDHVYICWQ